MNRIKVILQGFYKGKDLKKQTPPMLIGVFMMGFSLSFLRLVDWGTDTFTNMNLAISARVGMSLGNWQLILNVILFILVIAFGSKLYIATILMALTLGPAIEFVGNALTEANNLGENKTKPAPVGPVYQN
ncbi:MAG: hypothetical protein IJ791_04500 [Lachnospiraceae bacterium]|nr:hypothetical protein [Lachnospiraceae bacterium]